MSEPAGAATLILAVVAAGGVLHESLDGGASWRRRADTLPSPTGVLIC